MKVRTKENITYYKSSEKHKISFYIFLVIVIWFLQSDISLVSFFVKHKAVFLYAGILLPFALIFYIFRNKIKYTYSSINSNIPKPRQTDSYRIIYRHLNNSNFINHHKYYKNKNLEKKYALYKLLKLIKFIVWNFILIALITILWIFFPKTFFEIFAPFIVLWLWIAPLFIKDMIINMIYKDKNQVNIYFRSINPRYFQKTKKEIFFY